MSLVQIIYYFSVIKSITYHNYFALLSCLILTPQLNFITLLYNTSNIKFCCFTMFHILKGHPKCLVHAKTFIQQKMLDRHGLLSVLPLLKQNVRIFSRGFSSAFTSHNPQKNQSGHLFRSPFKPA